MLPVHLSLFYGKLHFTNVIVLYYSHSASLASSVICHQLCVNSEGPTKSGDIYYVLKVTTLVEQNTKGNRGVGCTVFI